MIVRSTPAQNYSIVNNAMLEQSSMTFAAKGLLVYLLSKPANWRVSDRHLATVGPEGRRAVQTMLRELEAAGYLVRSRYRDEKGLFAWVSVVYDEPQTTHEQAPGTQSMARSSMARSTRHPKPHQLISTDVTSTDLTNTQCISSPPDGSEGARQPDGEAQPVHVKPKRAKRQATPPEKAPAVEADGAAVEAPAEQTEHQKFFHGVCYIVGWDYKTLTSEQQAQVAQTVGILQKAGYERPHLRQFWETVWPKDWRWLKHKQRPTLNQLRSEIGKLRIDAQKGALDGGNGTDRAGTDTEDLRRQLREKRQQAKQREAGLPAGGGTGGPAGV